ncbi:Sodium/calcium exchanger protein-domain-containing protein [Mycena rosella]|uniref:Sodium/calcium exchanger protein-domain-containing protein n=1 Tax=Mycena rosella TaxID=1033263 RepID=A0AAD7CS66_MYCRO|nr:Sodium/calcium exchanger protein-domain-containing protein [Mycena rosella]
MGSPPKKPTIRSRSTPKFNAASSLRAIPPTVAGFFSAIPIAVPRFFRSLLKPAEEVGPIPGVKASLRAIALCSWFNICLPCIPVSWALHWATPNLHVWIFVTGFVAILPLAKLLAFATDDLSLRVSQALAGLINATLGNAVELIVAIIALRQCELGIVQSSLIGSILSNLLLVLGMCFFTGGIKFAEQGFGMGAAQLNSSLLTLSAACVLLPTAYNMVQLAYRSASADGTDGSVLTNSSMPVNGTVVSEDVVQAQILKFSHGLAIIMLFIYICYIVFQLGSHAAMFKDDSTDIAKSTAYMRNTPSPSGGRADNNQEMFSIPKVMEPESMERAVDESEEEMESPQLNGWVCLGLLLVVTALVGVTAEFLVGSINGLTESGHITKEFVGIILLPIVGNAAEHVSAVTVAIKDKLTLSIGVAVGSSIQIALFVIPFIVLVGWGMGKPLTLLFDPYEVACLFVAVLTVNYVLQDGKSNWLEGMILMCLYLILATLFFSYPGIPTKDHFAQCT